MTVFKTITKSVCSLSIALSPAYSFAAETGVESGATKTTTIPAVNSSANSNGSKNNSAQAFNAVASATEFAVAAQNWSRCPEDGSACAVAALFTAMGIMSMKQSKANGQKAGESYNTADLSDAYGTGNYNSGLASGSSSDPDYQSNASVGSSYMKKAEAGLSSLKAQGLVNSSATKITSPDGKSYNVSDLSSAAGMASAGIPQGAIDAAMATSKDIEKKALEKVKIGALTKAQGYDESSGGGGGSRYPSGDGSSGSGPYPGYAGARGSSSLLDKDNSRLAAGMSKNYHGEPIGVAADSIFLMMSRRYKVKESQDSFFGVSDVDLKK
ncbi:hypothetical protein DOM22_19375 [Bdellovibrio sp. ZAP7]|uniref:hypothetical protein n=1 Tax=Bdellovibrio sp. ZAP7 TaxID=2231053 RepID=UPI001157B1CB|nr:hypothetical protein [Bdellovibrio sp. ZAP7]QDK47172.1 hypothetical protein DOM22_19375 [Bdellovibrio sp. ZAP7]